MLRIPLGHFHGWVSMRFPLVASMIGLFILVFFSNLKPGAVVIFIPFLLVVRLMEWKFPIAYGYANDEGIRFRRWVRWHSAKWNEVEDIEWRSARATGFLLFLKKAPGRPNKLFLQNSPLSRLVGSSTDNIPWIEYQIKNASENPP